LSVDADDQLKEVVARLAARDGCTWAGIFFVENGVLALGPESGEADEARRTTVPVTWRGERIAELAVDGDAGRDELETVAAEISELCLVGWDTAGEPWEP
jgi:hypothetical protein